MKIKSLLCALIAVMLGCNKVLSQIVWDGDSVASNFASGIGTDSDPYLVTSAPEFMYFLKSNCEGNTYQDKHIRLMTDITIGDNLVPFRSDNLISRYVSSYTGGNFSGYLDGNGHFITSWKFLHALFGSIDGVVCNLGIKTDNSFSPKDSNERGTWYHHESFAFKLEESGIICNCVRILDGENLGSYYQNPEIMPFVRSNYGVIVNCVVKGVVNTTKEYGMNLRTAGIAVENNGTVIHCDCNEFYVKTPGLETTSRSVTYNSGRMDYGEVYKQNQILEETDELWTNWTTNHPNYIYNLPTENTTKEVTIRDSYGIIDENVFYVIAGSDISNLLARPSVSDCIFSGWKIGDKEYITETKIIVKDNCVVSPCWLQKIIKQPDTDDINVRVSDSSHAQYKWWYTNGEKRMLQDWTSPKTSHDCISSQVFEVEAESGQIINMDWCTSSESCDKLIVKINGVVKLEKGGVNNKGTFTYKFPSKGLYKIELQYSKDSSDSEGEDLVSVKNVYVCNAPRVLDGEITPTLNLSSIIESGVVWCEISYTNSPMVLLTSEVKVEPTEKPTLKGDINEDGKVDIEDVTALINIVLGKK